MAPAAAPWALLAILLVALLISLWTDLRSRRILNLVTLPAFAAALLARLLLVGWDGPFGLGSGLIGAATAFVPFFALAWMGGMGMGDVKLVSVVGACLGWERILFALFCIALVGGLQGVLALIWSGAAGRMLRRFVLLLGRSARLSKAEAPASERLTVPYGVAIALGTAWAIWWRPWLA